ncbi:helix-turn-helix domain-containing protein [Rhodanobacter sp. L36]|uniref:helix-turn-helix domain-containing protein n=1 Tax=Rhodanobacter sp. L36 TaxID=1747221 RepID=UPI00131D498E|nr:helix-turn-helix domain-containing protein [Rhodanobacter sp. L36]
MNPLHNENGVPRPLEALGISEMEERTYRALLANRMATADDIANLISLPLQQAQQLLDSVEIKGLATHSPERPPRYIAAPPELAVEALASRRQADIERARLTIPELKEQAGNSTGPTQREQIVEVITNRAALGQILMQLHQTLQTEAFGFQRAPMLTDARQEAMRPGIRIRSISDTSYLDLPGAVESLRLVTAMGEEARIFPTLPVKMFVADRRIGVIPLNAADPNGPILLVRPCALLDALCALFDIIWERATPIGFSRSGELEMGTASPRMSEAAEQLIPLLAAGLNDKAIAHEAGISDTTLTRRVSELMKRFDARTRFQLGWSAALEAFPRSLTNGNADVSTIDKP